MMEETTMVGQTLVQVQKQEKLLKVMVAIDESEGSLYALQRALEYLFIHHDTGAPAEDGPPIITVLHVQPPFQMPYTAVPVGPGITIFFFLHNKLY